MPAGDIIKLSAPATRGFWEIPVLFEDEHLLALDKPAGLLTSPDRHDPKQPSLISLLHEGIAAGKPWVTPDRKYLANCHRLDADTSGVLLLAKNKEALVALADQFGTTQPARRYLVLVAGAPMEDQFDVDAKLMPHPLKPGLMRLDRNYGKKTLTQFAVLERFRGYTLLRAEPVIERMHQIRLHLKFRKLHVVGDSLYRGAPLRLSKIKRRYEAKPGEEERPLISRAAIHAEELEINHPVTGERLVIKAPLPKDFSVGLKYLRRFAG
jgi:23S rRNA pseudouridine1911/1915/1917 synthase